MSIHLNITLANTRLKAGDATTVTFAFNEAVSGFANDDVVLTDANGTLGTLTPNANRTVWTATFTPTANVEDASNTISVNLAGVIDAAGTAGTGTASSANYSIDTKRPLVNSITIADTKLCAGESTTVTLTFSEAIDRDSFTLNDLGFMPNASTNVGTLSNLRTTDGITWQFTLTAPTSGTSSTGNNLGMSGDSMTDIAGNAGGVRGLVVFDDAPYDIDLVRPTATITLTDNALTVGETTTVTFAFSEPVTGFTREDIVLTDANGTLGPLTANADGKTWTATFTPTANVNDATNTIRVNLTGVSDIAGNAGVGTASSSNYTVSTRSANTADPTVTITLADTSLTVGETTAVTFAFSEAVRGFTNDDVVLTDANGTLGPLTANADGKTWTATFTPTNNIEDSSNTIGVNLAGVTNAAGTGTGPATSANYSIDTKRANTDPKARAGDNLTFSDRDGTAGHRAFLPARTDSPPQRQRHHHRNATMRRPRDRFRTARCRHRLTLAPLTAKHRRHLCLQRGRPRIHQRRRRAHRCQRHAGPAHGQCRRQNLDRHLHAHEQHRGQQQHHRRQPRWRDQRRRHRRYRPRHQRQLLH
ncbi:hypothetical protein D5038_07380 [Verminephrobacter aporrectodeae subsp. tuberculatae]|nr:hypothetical protein [Verminephrobacter aporrectodeae subsp. tuberculatae]